MTMKNQTLNVAFRYLAIVAMILLFSSCAQAVNYVGEPVTYGFFGGLWHGLIAPFDFVWSLVPDTKVLMYATNNTGHWYDFGFITGIGILFIGGTSVGNTVKL